MSSGPASSLRRLVLLMFLLAAGALAVARLRSRRAAPEAAPAEWPPFEPRLVAGPPEQAVPSVPATQETGSAVAWVVPEVGGVAPNGYPVKVKLSSGIFHVPGGRFYDRTNPDRCYPDAAAAETDGYRPSKS
jgi:hypothetical protein